jgi:hypothetical protein
VIVSKVSRVLGEIHASRKPNSLEFAKCMLKRMSLGRYVIVVESPGYADVVAEEPQQEY